MDSPQSSASPMSCDTESSSSVESESTIHPYLQKQPLDPAVLEEMARQPNQQRLYIINRAGTGEAQYILLNQKRTDIESYSVRFESWKVTKGISNFGVAVVNNVLYVIGGYDIKNCKHLHRVVR